MTLSNSTSRAIASAACGNDTRRWPDSGSVPDLTPWPGSNNTSKRPSNINVAAISCPVSNRSKATAMRGSENIRPAERKVCAAYASAKFRSGALLSPRQAMLTP